MKYPSPITQLSRSILASSIATLLSAFPAQAATVIKANTGSDLTLGSSWDGSVPAVGDTAQWTANSNAGVFTLGDGTSTGNVTWGRLWFGATAGENMGAIVVGNPGDAASITLTTTSTSSGTTYAVVNNSLNSVTINNAIIGTGVASSFSGTPSLPSTRSLTFSVASAGNLTLTNSVTALGSASAGDGAIYLRGSGSGVGTILGTLNIDGPLVKTDTGTWVLSGASNSISSVVLQNGVLRLGSDGAAGSGKVWFSGAATLASADSTARSFSNLLDFTPLGANTATFGQTATGNGALTFSGNIELGTASRGIATNVSTTFTGDISGASGGITKSGAATLIFSGTNTYTGSTTIDGGTLSLHYGTNDTSKLSDTASLILNSGTLSLTGASGSHLESVGSTTVGGIFTINRNGANTAAIALGAITRNPGGFLNVAEANLATTTTANDATGILAGITLNGGLAANDGSNKIVAYSGHADVNRLGGVISNAPNSNARLIEAGSSGSVTLGAGTTTINTLTNAGTAGLSTVSIGAGNTLRLGAAGQILSGASSAGLTLSAGTLTAGGTADTAGELLISNLSSVATTIGSVISNNGTGAVSLSKAGSGTLILTAANTSTGATVVGAGTLQVGNNDATALIGNNAAAVSIASGATLQFYRSGTGVTVSNPITGTGVLEFKGSGTSNNGAYLIGGNNAAFSGTVIANNSRVQIDSANDLGSASVIVNSGGSVFLSGTSSTVITNPLTLQGIGWTETTGNLGALRLSAGSTWAGPVTLAGNTRINANSASNTGTISGVISGGFALEKTGAGTITLTGNNTYTGATTVAAGTLIVNGSVTGSAVTVNNSTAILGGTGTTGALTLTSGSIAPGNAGAGILNVGNTALSGGTLALEINGTTLGTQYDQLNVTGSTTIGAAVALTLNLGSFDPLDNGSQSFTIVNNDLADPIGFDFATSKAFSFNSVLLNEGSHFVASGQEFSISYAGGDGNDVVLTAVPEPSAALSLIGGVAMAFGMRRRRAVR